jgi:GAF domain-containing protein
MIRSTRPLDQPIADVKRNMLLFVTTSSFIFIALLIALVYLTPPDVLPLATTDAIFITSVGALLLVLLTLTLLRRYIRVIGYSIGILLLLLIYIAEGGDASDILLIFVMMATLFTAIVFRGVAYWLALGLIGVRMAIYAASAYADIASDFTDPLTIGLSVFSTSLLYVGLPLGLGGVLFLFAERLERQLGQRQRYADLLEASADIGQNMSQMLELDDLLKRAAEIIRDRFAFYHVQIFLVDEDRKYAYLTASTGEIGEQMLARNHRLPINAASVIGRVTQAGDVIVARDTDRDGGHSFNELLPDTRSELGLPIMDNEGIIGAVDVQSRRPNVFSETEIRVLQVIATQLATAIRNARLFQNQADSVQENKRLFIESETNLREIQRLNRQLTKQAWQDYLFSDHRIDGVTLSDQTFKNHADWTETMKQASRRRRPIQSQVGDSHTIAVPIELRGEVIGAIEIESGDAQTYDDIADMIRAISQRLAVSLDNARLFEETNEATAQEQRIGEIVAQYQTADTVDELLKITLSGLTETLGADEATIRVGALEDDDADDRSDNPNPNGGTS